MLRRHANECLSPLDMGRQPLTRELVVKDLQTEWRFHHIFRDMIAIPECDDGAMENYGLVTYRETALLYNEKHSAAANKQWLLVVEMSVVNRGRSKGILP